MPKRTYFKQEWINPQINSEWAEIILPVEDNPFAFLCILCKKKVNLSNMGRQSIISHLKSTQHIKNTKLRSSNVKIDTFTQVNGNKEVYIENTQVTDTKTDQNQNKIYDQIHVNNIQMGKYFNKPNVFSAEIRWVFHLIESHSSYSSCSKTIPVLKKMFFDSNIAQNMSLGPTKASYLLVYGLAPYFTDILEKTLKECEYVVVCFDESLNKVAQKGQMDLVLRYWDKEVNLVVSKYLKSVFIEGRATAENILKHFFGRYLINIFK
ncbi:hypothetical protein NQ314_006226 [Rhamnusium bicolor]|uniref:Uncharacterized protein n=1 Tax=Rhamnusium bicolor TaxID=1586634 RepID=A0AAV8Z6R9_9CUCU|nr:hypothetical protein NQ314_006226 [Rhamnusium bicolor]